MTTLEQRIAITEHYFKMACKKYNLPVDIVGRQHLTVEQIEFLKNQPEEEFQDSIENLKKHFVETV